MAHHVNVGNIFFKHQHDIWTEPNIAIACTVNTVGAMGAGIALEFKKRHPDLYEAYRKACRSNVFDKKGYFYYKTDKVNCVCLYTKRDWKNDSKLEYIEDTLTRFDSDFSEHQVDRLYLPPLGCGNGNLNWDKQVYPLIKELTEYSNVNYEIVLPYAMSPNTGFMRAYYDCIYFSGDVALSPTNIRPFVYKDLNFLSVMHGILYYTVKTSLHPDKEILSERILHSKDRDEYEAHYNIFIKEPKVISPKFNENKNRLLFKLYTALIDCNRMVQTSLAATDTFPLIYTVPNKWLGIGRTVDQMALLGDPTNIFGNNEVGNVLMELRVMYCFKRTKWPSQFV